MSPYSPPQDNLAPQPADPSLTLSIAMDPVIEGTGPVAATVSVAQAPANDIVVTLSSSVPDRLGVPSTVTISAQTTSAAFAIDVPDNQVVDGDVDVVVSANAPNYTSDNASVGVLDND